MSSADFAIASLISSSDFIGKMILLVLLISSIWSWSVIISKLIITSRLRRKMRRFSALFNSSADLKSLNKKIKNGSDPLSDIFVDIITEVNKSSNIIKKEYVTDIADASRNCNMNNLHEGISLLATISSSAPFIGLFGTVWGIINSFQSIAISNNTSLAVVAPGIAEALFATAAGLFVSIPANIFYNYFVSQIENIESRIDEFVQKFTFIITNETNHHEK